MLKRLWKASSGRKTYITAAGGALVAVGSVLTGQMEAAEAGKLAFEALLAVFIRRGIG